MRFYKPTPVDPVSTYVSSALPYDFLLKSGEAIQGQYDKANTALEEIGKNPIEGGYSTTDRAEALKAKNTETLNMFTEQLNNSENPAAIARKMTSYLNDLKNSKEFQTIKQDAAHKAEVDKTMKQQGFDNSVQRYYKDGKFVQQSGDFNQDWYKTTTPGDSQKDFKPFYDQLHESIDLTYNPIIETADMLPDGSIRITNMQNGEEVKRITKDQVRAAAEQLAVNDPNFNALPSINYAREKAQFDNPNYKWTNNDSVDLMVDNFLGDYLQKKEIQKQLNSRIIKAPTAESGSGKGDGEDNVFLRVMTTTDKNGGKSKQTSNAVVAALVGGTPVTIDVEYSNGTKGKAEAIEMDATGKTFVVGNPTTMNGEDFSLLENYKTYTAAQQNILNKSINSNRKNARDKGYDAANISEDGAKRNVKDPLNYFYNLTEVVRKNLNLPSSIPIYSNSNGEVIVDNSVGDGKGNNFYDMLPQNIKKEVKARNDGRDIKPGESFILYSDNIDVYASPEEKKKKLAIIAETEKKGSDEAGKKLAVLRLEMAAKGIDVDSEEFKKKLNKLQSDPKLLELSTKLEGKITGNQVFTRNNNGDNTFTDKNGTMWEALNQRVSGAQLEQWGINPNDYPKYISLVKDGSFIHSGLADDAQYIITVNTKVEGDIPDMTANVQTGFYTNRVSTEKQMSTFIQENESYVAANKVKSTLGTLSKQKETTLISGLSSLMGSITDPTTKTNVDKAYSDAMTIKDPVKRKEELAEIYMYITDPEGYSKYLNSSSITPNTNTQGKATGGWGKKKNPAPL